MKKNVAALRVVDRDDAAQLPELSDELRLALADVVGAAREGLLAMSVAVGLRVMAEMMDDEVTAKVGPSTPSCPTTGPAATARRRDRWCSAGAG